MKVKRLGDMLIGVNLITEEQLNQALEAQKGSGKRLGQILIEMGFIKERQLIEALEMQLGIEFVDLSGMNIANDLINLVPKNIAKANHIVPVKIDRDTLYIATADPLNFKAIEEVRKATRMRIVPMISTYESVDRTIATIYGNEGASRAIEEMKKNVREAEAEQANTATRPEDESGNAPTVRLVNSILERAIIERSSDIHLEPTAGDLRVRMRIDGMMREILTIPKELQNSVISRLKVMGGMDITEKRIPLDGRAQIIIKSKEVDLRLSTLPTIHGEKFVIRILDKSAQFLDKSAIGLIGDDARKYDDLLKARSGVILIAGPTGSGKSSTMYTMIRQLNTPDVNMITLEDPVEYQLDGIAQVQINEKTGMTFANGLRAILRQDPDIIAVGEIRDGETAEIAMRAAITGHVVLSTIHTSNAVAAIDRLVDSGVQPYLISGALRGVISQRLVRKICPACREEYVPSASDVAMLGQERSRIRKFYHGTGCPMCFHTGYKGRVGVFEVLKISNNVRKAVNERKPKEVINEIVAREGVFVSMKDNAIRLVAEGETTLDEALKVIESVDL